MDAAHDVSPGSLPDIVRKLTSAALLFRGSDGMSKFALSAVLASQVVALDWKPLACELDSYGRVVFPNVLTPEQGCKEFCLE